MYKIVMIALCGSFLSACATNQVSNTEKEMYQLNIEGYNAGKSGNIELSIKKYEQCIGLDPSASAITNNRARRWCQNNLIAVINNCNEPILCQKSESLRLAKDLYNYNQFAYKDDHYAMNIAESHYINGEYVKAVEIMEKLLENMNGSHKSYQLCQENLRLYKSAIK
jgi:tetratricopeptide (TPR) repeat protein